MLLETSVGRLPNQAVRHRANSSEKRPAHMVNTENMLTSNIVGWLFSNSSETGTARRKSTTSSLAENKIKKT